MSRNRILTSAVLVFTLAGGLFLGIRQFYPRAIDYAEGNAGAEVVALIPTGASGSDVAHILVRDKVVLSWQAFINRAAGDPRSTQIQPGAHRISTHLSAKVALEQLLDRSRMVGLINIPEGTRAANILKILAKSGLGRRDLESAFAAARVPTGYAAPSVEGYLFPASYSFAPGTSAVKIFQAMLGRFQSEATSLNLATRASALHLKPGEIVTIASLVQGEGGPGDFGKIARVILNRLADGMKLRLDTTVLYALNVAGRINVRDADLLVSSKYNTYKYPGLPPGPIGSPGRQALLGALNPTPGPWLYFITVRPGDTRFTASESEFFKWKSEYEKNYAAGAFNKSGTKP
jgi:UPF0755 protein